MRFRNLIFLLILAISAAGCGGGGRSGPTTPDQKTHYAWTVLLYIDGRNDLAPYAIKNLNQMESAGSTSQVALVTQIAHSSGYDSTQWDGVRRYLITKDSDQNKIGSTLLADLGSNVDMASPQTLSSFISWGVSQYPADHYMLVLWDHGSGWKTLTMHSRRGVKSIFYDQQSGNQMDLAELTQALQGSPKFDLVMFDACLMSMIEVGTAVKDSANLMVSSEDNIPGDGQRYNEVIPQLVNNPGMTAKTLGTAFVDQYINIYSTTYGGTIEMALIDLNSLGQLSSDADQLSTAVIDNLSSVKSEVEAAQSSAQHFDWVYGDYADYKDLYDFARILSASNTTAVKSAAQTVMSSVSSTVLYERHNGAQVANAHGISVYLPNPGANDWLTRYQSLQFAHDTHWAQMIAQY